MPRGADAGEVGEQAQPGGTRLLGVKLNPEQRRPFDRAGEAPAVFGGPEGVPLLRRPGRQRVDEVEGRLGVDPVGQRRLALPADRFPADVRDLEPGRLERRDVAGEQPEAIGAAELARALEEELHPQADAEHGGALPRALGDQPVEPQLSHALDRLREGTHAGEDEPVGGASRLGVGGPRDLDADALERLLNRAQVAHPVVEDREPGHVSVPLVDGTPLSPGSIATAWRSVRAKALKQASIM